ncbi:protein-glutamate O-methyltransferase CheR [Treponema parvum]|uniref:protein-glutamate O-methyltransferase n=1 Tax=Treponema parvum TaxID=138851 RepID=A0A975ICT3_9SPIR|nr:protein-glutamate O-methyltransferase CheR [Treponema parvum]QTQ12331.1 protein-glutamate O-methyltransferase CheR [Treponema parvum]
MADLLTDAEFEKFRKIIYEQSGITFSETNRSVLDSRIKEQLHENKIDSVGAYYNLIMSDKEAMKIMLDSVTTNLTRFFRNQPHFDAFTNYVVPHLLEEKKKTVDKVIRVWSAGCSTGEEPYTIAMILKDILPAGFDFAVTASDISLKSLMVGQQGFYSNARITGVPEKYLERFFTKSDSGYQVKKELMDKIKFDYHNLQNDSGMRNLDVIFCRNVLIYFDEAAQLAVINRFWNSLLPHSYLFIGHSESLFGMDTKFEFLKTDWACLYQKNIK